MVLKYARRLYFSVMLLSVSFFLAAEPIVKTNNGSPINVILLEQPLEDALTQLAALHKTPIIFRSDIVKGINVTGLEGKYSLGAALSILLKGTSLIFTNVDNIMVTITPIVIENLDVASEEINGQRKPIVLDIEPPSMSEVVVVGESLGFSCCRDTPSTATKTYVPTIEVPKSLEGISSDLFSDRGNATLSEAFRDYSSVNVTDLRGNINVRGFKLSGRSLLKDGQSIVSYGIAPLTLNNIDGIEVAKGANSTLYGYGQPGAVVNLVTKKPSQYAFTNLKLNVGNYDQYVALDSTGPTSTNSELLYRFNLLAREEKAHKDSQGQLIQIEASPSVSYQINDTDKLSVAADYNHQQIEGYEGNRPFDDLALDDILGIGLFEVVYPFWEEKDPSFYPYTGREDREKHDSVTTELRVNYQGLTRSGWDLVVNAYYGHNEQKRTYANDVGIWLNPAYDPQPFVLPIFKPTTYLETLFNNNADFIQNYQDVRTTFIYFMQDTYGLGLLDIVDATYNGGEDFPLWEDGQVHFYQIALDSAQSTDKINIDISVGNEFTLLDADHFILLGLLHTVSTSESLVNQRYNKALYEQGAGLVSAGGSDNLYLGWALQRYSMHPWYYPFHSNSPNGIVLPTAISRLAGVEPGSVYALDGVFPYAESTINTTLTGVYLQDQISMNEQFKLLVSVGFYQYDREYEVTALNALLTLVGEMQSISSESVASDTFTAPQVGLTYLPVDNVSFYGNYGLQYDLLNGLDKNFTPLQPEETITYEVGMKWWPNTDFSVSLALFDMTKKNWSISDGENLEFRAQEGEFQSVGTEFSLVGFITPNVKTAINFTETKTKSLKQPEGGRDDAFLAHSQVGIPSSSGSFWVQYHTEPFGTHGWSWGFGATYASGRQFTQQFVESTFGQYTLLDAALAYLHEDFRIALNVDNITDEQWMVGSSITPKIANSPRYLSEGPGIRYRLTLELFY